MSSDESDLSPGWYLDEFGSGRRYWTGQKWLSETEAGLSIGGIPQSESGFFKPFREHPRWMQWTVIIGILMAIGNRVSGD